MDLKGMDIGKDFYVAVMLSQQWFINFIYYMNEEYIKHHEIDV